eukprot:EG_transcript_16294
MAMAAMWHRFDPRQNYYAALGVAPTATRAEIRDAYRRLAPENKWDSSDAAPSDQVSAVKRAYLVLSDAATRQMYDLARKPRVSSQVFADPPAIQTFDMPAPKRSLNDELPLPSAANPPTDYVHVPTPKPKPKPKGPRVGGRKKKKKKKKKPKIPRKGLVPGYPEIRISLKQQKFRRRVKRLFIGPAPAMSDDWFHDYRWISFDNTNKDDLAFMRGERGSYLRRDDMDDEIFEGRLRFGARLDPEELLQIVEVE